MTIEAKLDRIIEILEGRAAAKPMQQESNQGTGVAVQGPWTPSPEKKQRAAKVAAVAATPAVAPAAAASAVAPAAPPSATLDDVRVALVALSTRTGSRAKSDEILAKFAGEGKPAVTGSLKAEDYAKVVAECQSAG
jgi:hypothetical protein